MSRIDLCLLSTFRLAILNAFWCAYALPRSLHAFFRAVLLHRDYQMGWFEGVPSKVSTVSEVPQQHEALPKLLEDLPPKFEDREPTHAKRPTFADAFQRVKLSDFTLENYVSMPCFREAMLTGFQAMGVLGAVTFLIHKNPGRSVNWSIGGFFLGSVIGWEQCRSIRRRSFQTVEAARQANQEKVNKRIAERQNGGDALEKWDEIQKGR